MLQFEKKKTHESYLTSIAAHYMELALVTVYQNHNTSLLLLVQFGTYHTVRDYGFIIYDKLYLWRLHI